MPEMTCRERYHAINHFKSGVRTLDWEFAYWAATIERWYGEGLQRSAYSPPPGLPGGDVIGGEGLPFPFRPGQFRYRDCDVHNAFAFDEGAVRLPIHWRHSPRFVEVVLDEDETTRLIVTEDGVTARVKKASDSIPHFQDWPVHDRASWERVKAERFRLDNMMTRFPNGWETSAATFDDHDYPLGILMDGFFSMHRELMGVERQLVMYYDDPELMHDINRHLAKVWLPMLEEVVARVELDFVIIWEDMAYNSGPLISPRMFEEFCTPYYRQVTGFLKAHGVDAIVVDTDGNCWKLIPKLLEAGVTGLYPFEVQAGMDIVEVRKQYPQLLIQGGLDKRKIAQGKEAIDAELEAKMPFVLSQGGYIPYADHLVPPDVPWDNFCYYRNRLRQYIERYQSQ